MTVTMTRGGFLSALVVGGAATVVVVGLGGLAGLGSAIGVTTEPAPADAVKGAAVAIPGVVVEDETALDHAKIKHGAASVAEIMTAFFELVMKNPQIGQQPPCDDGPVRIPIALGAGEFALLVLDIVAELMDGTRVMVRRTAFKASQHYINSVMDACGDGVKNWRGHEYAM